MEQMQSVFSFGIPHFLFGKTKDSTWEVGSVLPKPISLRDITYQISLLSNHMLLIIITLRIIR